MEEVHQMETDLPPEDHHLGLETLFGELTKTRLILEAIKGIPGEIHLEATRQDLPMVSNRKRRVQTMRRTRENGS